MSFVGFRGFGRIVVGQGVRLFWGCGFCFVLALFWGGGAGFVVLGFSGG